MIWVTPQPGRRRWAISPPRRYPVPIDRGQSAEGCDPIQRVRVSRHERTGRHKLRRGVRIAGKGQPSSSLPHASVSHAGRDARRVRRPCRGGALRYHSRSEGSTLYRSVPHVGHWSEDGLHCHELEHEDNGSINFMNVVNVPESRMNTVDSPSYACPAVTNDTSAPSTEDGAYGIGSSSATLWGSIWLFSVAWLLC